MPTKNSTRRRTPSAGASGGVSVEPVKFPVNVPKPAQTAPEGCHVITLAVDKDAARVMLLPDDAAVRKLLDDAYGPAGWCMRRYYAGSQLWCQVGVYSPDTGEYVYKDAAAMSIPANNPAKMQEITSFLAAAALWGAGADVLDVGKLLLKATAQMPIVESADKKRWMLGTSLRVDRFARDDTGRITMVQFATTEGNKILWPETT